MSPQVCLTIVVLYIKLASGYQIYTDSGEFPEFYELEKFSTRVESQYTITFSVQAAQTVSFIMKNRPETADSEYISINIGEKNNEESSCTIPGRQFPAVSTPGILNGTQYHQFWIKYITDSSLVEFGVGTVQDVVVGCMTESVIYPRYFYVTSTELSVWQFQPNNVSFVYAMNDPRY